MAEYAIYKGDQFIDLGTADLVLDGASVLEEVQRQRVNRHTD